MTAALFNMEKVLCVLFFCIFVLYVNLDIFVKLTLANYLKNVQVI